MFKLFRRATPTEKLEKKIQKLLKESFDLSKINRSLGDQKYAEAKALQDKLESMTKNQV